jgi:hypothetical protein
MALFWRLTLLQETVWNIAFASLEFPYDYSSGQLGLRLLAMGYPLTKLDKLTDYLTLWSRMGNYTCESNFNRDQSDCVAAQT